MYIFRNELISRIVDLNYGEMNGALLCVKEDISIAVITEILSRIDITAPTQCETFVKQCLNRLSRSAYRLGGKERPWSVDFDCVGMDENIQVFYIIGHREIRPKILSNVLLDRRYLADEYIKKYFAADVNVLCYRIGGTHVG